MQEEELLALIRETVAQLQATADRLEQFAQERQEPNPGFEVPDMGKNTYGEQPETQS